jgi:hypothetical protein
MSSPTLDSFRERFSRYGPPVIVFNKSHSGSRMLAELLSSAGVFMGSHLNESRDSLDVFELVDYLVTHYYPDYSPLWDAGRAADGKLAELLERVFTRHLQDAGAGASMRWGWKLCETVYIVPVLDYCFPGSRYVHLIRDGRDVAFCNHRGPDRDFWRKVYFNTGRIRTFAGLRLTPLAYRRKSHFFNALHWVNSVSVGRAFGAMLRERYVEVRYEDLCLHFAETARRLVDALELPCPEETLGAFRTGVYGSSIGKHRSRSKSDLREVLRIEKPLLLSLGYLEADTERISRFPWRSHWADALIDVGRRMVDRAERRRAFQFIRSRFSGSHGRAVPDSQTGAPNVGAFLAEFKQRR